MSKNKNKSQPPENEAQSETVAPEAELAPDISAAPDEQNSPESQLSAEKDKYLRLAAEYDNYRKRSVKEREAIFSDVRADTILKFLPVYDNLSRALDQETADDAYRRGVEMTMNQLKAVMEKFGVSEIEALGQTFDPEVHNAIMHVEDEKYGENEIILEFEKGFKMGDRVIRFSVVQVAN